MLFIIFLSVLFIFSIIFLYNAVSGEGFRGGGGGGGRVGGFGRYGGRAIGAGVVGLGADRVWRSNYYNGVGGNGGGYGYGYGWFPYYPSSFYNYPYNNLQM